MTPVNISASVRARLMNRARETGRPFQELLQYYGLERFLYRFASSKYRDKFILKGALMLRMWEVPFSRPTRDIDLLGHTDNSIENLETIFKEVCAVSVENDGMIFDPANVRGERIKEDAEYEGVRIKFAGVLERAKVPMQIDIGFGDVVYPPAGEREYPSLLGFPTATLRAYPLETVIAEKFQAMVYLGSVGSRMKDFYDIWLLSKQFDFDGRTLEIAIKNTFGNRQTEIETEPVSLTTSFVQAQNVQRQWTAFLKKGLSGEAPIQFQEIVLTLREFLLPVADSIAKNIPFDSKWVAPGPWISEK